MKTADVVKKGRRYILEPGSCGLDKFRGFGFAL